MQSQAKTVTEYLQQLPEDRREPIEAVRKVILEHIDQDFEEGMQYGMIGYYVPHAIYPAGYHCDPKQPLPYISLASQKNYMSLYMMSVYGSGEELKEFVNDWKKTGKKLDMGKCCIRFKKLDDLALGVIAHAIERVSVARHIEFYESAIKDSRKKSSNKKPAKKSQASAPEAVAKKKATKKSTAKKSLPKRQRAKK